MPVREGPAKGAETVQADQVPVDTDEQGRHGQQQQEFDKVLRLPARQIRQRQRLEDPADQGGIAGRGIVMMNGGFHEKSIIEIGHMLAADDGQVAETKNEVGCRHPAVVSMGRTHGQPVFIDPGLDPVMGLLIISPGQRQARHQPGGDAAAAEQGEQQPALAARVACAGFETLGGRHSGYVQARFVVDLIFHVAEQGQGLIRRSIQPFGETARCRGDIVVLGAGLGRCIQVLAGSRSGIVQVRQPGHRRGVMVRVHGAIELVTGTEGAVRRAGPFAPGHLPAFRMTKVGRFFGQLLAAIGLIPDVLLIEVERQGRRQPGFTGTLSLDQQRDLPGAGAGRQPDLVAEHEMASGHHAHGQRGQGSGGDYAQERF